MLLAVTQYKHPPLSQPVFQDRQGTGSEQRREANQHEGPHFPWAEQPFPPWIARMLLPSLLIALHVMERSRAARYLPAERLIDTATQGPCRRPVYGVSSGRDFPFISGAAGTSPRLWSVPPPCWRSCLCNCVAGQMGEVILDGKKNMLLSAGCFNFLFCPS